MGRLDYKICNYRTGGNMTDSPNDYSDEDEEEDFEDEEYID